MASIHQDVSSFYSPPYQLPLTFLLYFFSYASSLSLHTSNYSSYIPSICLIFQSLLSSNHLFLTLFLIIILLTPLLPSFCFNQSNPLFRTLFPLSYPLLYPFFIPCTPFSPLFKPLNNSSIFSLLYPPLFIFLLSQSLLPSKPLLHTSSLFITLLTSLLPSIYPNPFSPVTLYSTPSFPISYILPSLFLSFYPFSFSCLTLFSSPLCAYCTSYPPSTFLLSSDFLSVPLLFVPTSPPPLFSTSFIFPRLLSSFLFPSTFLLPSFSPLTHTHLFLFPFPSYLPLIPLLLSAISLPTVPCTLHRHQF